FDTGNNQQVGNMIRNQEGEPISAFFGYDVVGLFQSEDDVNSSPSQTGAAPGRFKYRDIDGDGVITPNDRTFLGDPNPDFSYGLNLNLYYKNFDISTNLYGSQGNEAINGVRIYTHFFGTYTGAKSRALLDA